MARAKIIRETICSLNRWVFRTVRTISAAQVAPSIAVKAYNSRAVPKMSYTAQFLPPLPPRLIGSRNTLVPKYLKSHITVSHTRSNFRSLPWESRPSLLYMLSSLPPKRVINIVICHMSILHGLHTDLLTTFEDITLSDAARGTRSHWQSPPLILNIIEGACGRQFSDDENTSHLIADALADAIGNESKIQKSIYTALHRT